jgi:hypothetical protein
MGGVGTSILGRPRHLPRDRRASHHPTSDYTLNCEEPHNGCATCREAGESAKASINSSAIVAGGACRVCKAPALPRPGEPHRQLGGA